MMKNIKEAMVWRYATKKFDSSKKIDESTLDIILESLRLSPSSYGLQPWKFIIVNNLEIRLRIKEASYGQPQTTDASHLIIFAIKKNINDKLVDDYVSFVSKESGTPIEKLEGLSTSIKGSFKGKDIDSLKSWATHQAYLALGVLITSCAVSGIDACPMEGFDSLKIDEILNLSNMGLESKAMVAIGYRKDDDMAILRKKIRFSKEDVFIEIN